MEEPADYQATLFNILTKFMKILTLLISTILLTVSCSDDSEALSNLSASEEFLSVNKNGDGVVSPEAGLQYKVINSGEGMSSPSLETNITAHFHGTLIDGSVFWSSVDSNQPLNTKASQLIIGCQKIIPLMKVGDKWKVFIHPSMAYGEQGRPGIPPNSLLIFDIELLSMQ